MQNNAWNTLKEKPSQHVCSERAFPSDAVRVLATNPTLKVRHRQDFFVDDGGISSKEAGLLQIPKGGMEINKLASHRGRRVETVSPRHEFVSRLEGILPSCFARVRQVDPKYGTWCSVTASPRVSVLRQGLDRVSRVFRAPTATNAVTEPESEAPLGPEHPSCHTSDQ